jgi:hypothetical protein
MEDWAKTLRKYDSGDVMKFVEEVLIEGSDEALCRLVTAFGHALPVEQHLPSLGGSLLTAALTWIRPALETAEVLISLFPDREHSGAYGETAVWAALSRDHLSLFDRLLDMGFPSGLGGEWCPVNTAVSSCSYQQLAAVIRRGFPFAHVEWRAGLCLVDLWKFAEAAGAKPRVPHKKAENLQEMCRVKIRQSLNLEKTNAFVSVPTLPITNVMKDFLLFGMEHNAFAK